MRRVSAGVGTAPKTLSCTERLNVRRSLPLAVAPSKLHEYFVLLLYMYV
jgi:hypothetical protein